MMLAVALVASMTLVGAIVVDRFGVSVAMSVASRYRYVVTDIRGSIEVGLDLGIALQDIRRVAADMEWLAQNDKQVLYIDVIDPSGVVVLSTDDENLGQSAGVSNFAADGAVDGIRWSSQGGIVVSEKAISPYGTVAATVVLAFSPNFIAERIQSVRWRIALIGGGAIIGFVVLISPIVWRLVKLHTDRLVSLAEEISILGSPIPFEQEDGLQFSPAAQVIAEIRNVQSQIERVMEQ